MTILEEGQNEGTAGGGGGGVGEGGELPYKKVEDTRRKISNKSLLIWVWLKQNFTPKRYQSET